MDCTRVWLVTMSLRAALLGALFLFVSIASAFADYRVLDRVDRVTSIPGACNLRVRWEVAIGNAAESRYFPLAGMIRPKNTSGDILAMFQLSSYDVDSFEWVGFIKPSTPAERSSLLATGKKFYFTI